MESKLKALQKAEKEQRMGVKMSEVSEDLVFESRKKALKGIFTMLDSDDDG